MQFKSFVVPLVFIIQVSPPSVDFNILPLGPTAQPVFISEKYTLELLIGLFCTQVIPPSVDLDIPGL